LVSFAGAKRYDRWEVIGPGGGGGMFLPTLSPLNNNDVLVSGDMTGFYISHDGGSSWRMFNLGDRAWFFVFDPVDPKVIYAKTAPAPVGFKQDRPFSRPALFRSADSGKTWRVVRADNSDGAITALAVDPSDSAILYAAFQIDKSFVLRVSPDRGKQWKKIADLPDGADKIFIDSQSPREDRTLYVIGASSVAVRVGGHWRSGQALKDVEYDESRPELHSRVVSAGFPQKGGEMVVYMIAAGKLHISDDGGMTWRESPLPASSWALTAMAVATSLYHPDVAYVSYYNRRRGNEALFGTAKTSDRGRTWQLVWKESITSAPNIHDPWMSELFGPGWGGNPIQLGVAPTNPDLCFGTDTGRTLRTSDGGKTWESVYSKKLPDETYTSTGLDVTTDYGVHFDPFDLNRVFISYDDIGLMRSDNGGKSWTYSVDGAPHDWTETVYWIVFDPQVRGRVWAAMSGNHSLPRHKSGFLQPGAGRIAIGGVCRSDDGGRTWTISNQGMPPTVATHIILDARSPVKARVLYVAGFAGGVFKSTDGGQSWARKNQGIIGEEPFAWRLAQDANGVLYLVVIRRNDDGSIGGEGDGALYRSTDGAEHWTKMQLPHDVNGPQGLEIDPENPQRLYLAGWARHPDATRTVGGGIFLSTDAGATWRQVLAKDHYVHDITVDSRRPQVVYAVGFESSAWRSDDRGEHWKRIKGYNFKWGRRVIPDPLDARKVYIATYGGSVWHGPAEGDSNAVEDILP
jgi:photosystem II stability/assembly factor-like uncharacterized protein